jgi:hypothetical protein
MINVLHSGSNELNDGAPRPRPRYKRRNSAVASTLLPMIKTSMMNTIPFQSSSADSTETLHLSTADAFLILDPSEAIKKAQELLQEKSESPPPLETVRAKKHKLKRASVPWGQTCRESTDVFERARKRHRHG